MYPGRRDRWRAAIRSGAVATCLALGVVLGSVARAAAPVEAEPDVSAWVGRYCTPLGCRGATDSALGNALGFGTAAAGAALLARRRRA